MLQDGPPHFCCMLAGSTVAVCMKKALQLVGDKPLEEFAERYPEEALRVYIRENGKPYNDESPVCSVGTAKRELYKVLIHAAPDICQALHPACLSYGPSHSCAKAVAGTSCGPGSEQLPDCAVQEFLERLRIFKRNCEVIREKNALKIAKGQEVSLPYPSLAALHAVLSSSASCTFHPFLLALVFSTTIQ